MSSRHHRRSRSRVKLSRRGSRRYFSKHASKSQSVNMRASPMRGGFRI